MAQLSPTEIQYELEHIHQDQVPNIIASYATCLSLAYIAVVLRFVARRTSRASLRADDLTIFIALVRVELPCLTFSRHVEYTDLFWGLGLRYRPDHRRLLR